MDAYIRVSQTGERTEDESTEVYEAQLREWSRATGTPLGLVLDDTDVSGSVAVADRKLERLIVRVESGESAGIVTPWLDRFGRDLIEGAVALKRISEAGGRLVTVKDGFDSASAGSTLVFNLRMAIAQDFLERSKANWNAAIQKAAARGAYLACRPPFGYGWDEGHVLYVDEVAGRLVAEAFVRRGQMRQNWAEIQRWLRAALDSEGVEGPRSKNGVRDMIANRAYLGEHRVQSGRKGEPEVLTDHHPAIVTPEQWEAAQWSGGFHGRNGASASASLRGLVWCGTCGRRLKVNMGGRQPDRYVNYACTNEGCAARAAIKAEILDPYVEGLVQDAAVAGEPHVVAVIDGDTRYEDAMAAVARARGGLEAYRDSPEILEELGAADFAAGLRVKRETLEAARAALAQITPPESAPAVTRQAGVEGAEAAVRAQNLGRFVDRIVIQPARFRKGIPPAERASVYLAGAEDAYESEALALAA